MLRGWWFLGLGGMDGEEDWVYSPGAGSSFYDVAFGADRLGYHINPLTDRHTTTIIPTPQPSPSIQRRGRILPIIHHHLTPHAPNLLNQLTIKPSKPYNSPPKASATSLPSTLALSRFQTLKGCSRRQWDRSPSILGRGGRRGSQSEL